MRTFVVVLAVGMLIAGSVHAEPGKDAFGDPLPSGAKARLGTTRLRHTERIRSVAFSPDGKTLASVDLDANVCAWDVATGKEIRRFHRDGALIVTPLWTSDGPKLALGCARGNSWLWDVLADAPIGKSSPSYFDPGTMAVSANGRITVTGSRLVFLSDTGTGKHLQTLDPFRDRPNYVAITPDGKVVAVTAERADRIQLYDVTTGNLLQSLSSQGQPTLLFSPDGRTLAVSSSWRGGTCLFDVASGKQIWKTSRGGDALAFSPDGGVLAFPDARAKTIVLWDLLHDRLVRSFPGFTRSDGVLAFSADGELLAIVQGDQGIRLWDVKTGEERQFPGHRGTVNALFVSADGRTVLSAGRESSVRVWDLDTGQERARLGCAARLSLSPDGTLLAALSSPMTLWDTSTGEVRPLGVKALYPGTGTTLSADGSSIFKLERRGRLEERDIGTGEHRLRGEVFSEGERDFAWTWSLAASPDGRFLAVGGVENIRSWEDEIPAETMHLWDLKGNKVTRRFEKNVDVPKVVRFSPDGTLIASTASRSSPVRVWDVNTGGRYFYIPELKKGRSSEQRPVAFSPDGRLLATDGSRNRLELWDVLTGKLALCLYGHTGLVTALAFTPDGKTLISGSTDSTILVWDLAAGKPAREPHRLWESLATEGEEWFVALRTLVASPRETVPFLATKLKPAGAEDPVRVKRWIAELDHDKFAVRVAASQELARLGDNVLSQLREALEGNPSAEAKRRLTQLVEKAQERTPSPEQIHLLHAVMVLEWIGSPEAKELLAKLAKGIPDARLTREAKASLTRLQPRPARRPFLPHGLERPAVSRNDYLDFFPTAVEAAPNPLGKLPRLANRNRELDEATLELIWADLGGAAPLAYLGIWDMAASPESALPFLAKWLKANKPDALRLQRAVQALELIGTPEAKALLGSLQTPDAKAALKRLRRRTDP